MVGGGGEIRPSVFKPFFVYVIPYHDGHGDGGVDDGGGTGHGLDGLNGHGAQVQETRSTTSRSKIQYYASFD